MDDAELVVEDDTLGFLGISRLSFDLSITRSPSRRLGNERDGSFRLSWSSTLLVSLSGPRFADSLARISAGICGGIGGGGGGGGGGAGKGGCDGC